MTETSRPLTDEERELVHWLMLNSNDKAAFYLSQISETLEAIPCGCGCTSIDFVHAGHTPDRKGQSMNILAEYDWTGPNGELIGIYLYAHGQLLSGLEVYSVDGLSDCKLLPEIESLRPFRPQRHF